MTQSSFIHIKLTVKILFLNNFIQIFKFAIMLHNMRITVPINNVSVQLTARPIFSVFITLVQILDP